MPNGSFVGDRAKQPPFVACGALVFQSEKLRRGRELFRAEIDGAAVNPEAVPGMIREAFTGSGQEPLSPRARIRQWRDDNNWEWRIVDGDRVYFALFIAKRNQLRVYAATPNYSAGSGVIIGPRHILTVTHNFTNSPNSSGCKFWPGLDTPDLDETGDPGFDNGGGPSPASLDPNPIHGLTSGVTYPDQPYLNDVVTDVSLVTLDEDLPQCLLDRIDDRVVLADPAQTPPSEGMGVEAVGYPHGEGGRMWVSAGEIVHVEDGLFFFTHQGLTPGCSGGPIWTRDDRGQARVIGVLSKTIDPTSTEGRDPLVQRLLREHRNLAVARHIGPDLYTQLPEAVRNRQK